MRRLALASAGLRRTATEVAIASFVLVLPLAAVLRPALGLGATTGAEPYDRWPVLGMSLGHAGLWAAMLGAVRLRRAPATPGHAGRRRWVIAEAWSGLRLIVALWAGALLAHLAGAAWASLAGVPAGVAGVSFARAAPLLAWISAVGGVVGYSAARVLVLAWPRMEQRRQTRLFWALTSAQIVAALAVVWSVAVILTLVHGQGRFAPPFGPEVLPAGAGTLAHALVWISTRLLPTITAFFVAGLVVSLFVLPLAATVSYLGLRRTTRRVEDLALAADALRAGNLATRVTVSGADEVAHLQAAFNAMATALERTLNDFQAERDRVAGLLEAHRQLVVSVSHELRTPVATLRGYLESAQRREEETVLPGVPAHVETGAATAAIAYGASGDHRNGAALRADLATMQREVVRLQALIDDLFTLSRAEVGRLALRLAPTDVVAAVQRLVETAAPLAWRQRRVEVLATIEGEVPPALADSQRVEQIVSNLLGNAIRHTPPGGLVAVAVEAEADAVRIDVRDTGAGIGPDDLAHVFERFYRGPAEDGTGTASDESAGDRVGLGLALVKELAVAMGGSAEATSTPGEGSCFTVRLPPA